MITAIVLVDTDVSRIGETAEEIAALDGVSEVYSVTGDVDLIAIVRVHQHEDLAGVIAEQLSAVSGVRGTRTYLGFRAYSRHDLDAAFALGLDENP